MHQFQGRLVLGQVSPLIVASSRGGWLCLSYVALVSLGLSVVPWHCDMCSNNAKAVMQSFRVFILWRHILQYSTSRHKLFWGKAEVLRMAAKLLILTTGWKGSQNLDFVLMQETDSLQKSSWGWIKAYEHAEEQNPRGDCEPKLFGSKFYHLRQLASWIWRRKLLGICRVSQPPTASWGS